MNTIKKISECTKFQQDEFQRCKEHTSAIYAMYYILYSEAQKAFDELEEMGMCRHKIKMYRNNVDKEWNKFQKTIKTLTETQDNYGLIMDMFVQAHGNLEENLTYLKVAIHNLFLKHEVEHASVCAQLLTAICIGDMSQSTWKGYFAHFRKSCGLDFADNFKFANTDKLFFYIRCTFEEVYKRNDILAVNDAQFQTAYKALENALIKRDYINDAAESAISYNKTIAKKYKKDIDEIKYEKNHDIIKQLSNKYKVSKL